MRTKKTKRLFLDIIDNYNKKQIEISLYHSLMDLIKSDFDVNLMWTGGMLKCYYPYMEYSIRKVDSDIMTKESYTANISFEIGWAGKFVNVQINENTKKFRFDWLNWNTK